jgi:formylglycine-generating enzyme required for sulfatase activity
MSRVAAVLLVVAGCNRLEPYHCEAAADCVRLGEAGTCEPTGFCSFADPECASGSRYGDGSGDLSGTCTDVVDGGPPDATPDASLPEDMVLVPATTFMMGCVAADLACGGDEMPLHAVSLSAFLIERTEVTKAAYDACVTAGACTAPSCAAAGDAHPAVCVSWDQATAYCASRGRRLPTEAERELATRGTDGRIYPWGDTAPDCSKANVAGCGGIALPVGSLPMGVSPYGALDMAGNVGEWVSDWYDGAYYAASPTEDPPGPAAGTNRSTRDTGFDGDPSFARASNRFSQLPATQAGNHGLRCVMDAP